MWHTFSIYRRLLGARMRSQMQYRFAFLMDLAGTGVTAGLEFLALALVLPRFGGLQGWTMGEIAFLYGQVEIAFGLMDLLFSGFDPKFFGQQVRRGTFDQILLRPVSVTTQVLTLDLALRRLGKIAVGIGIFALGLQRTVIVWTAVKLLYFPFVIGGMVCFFGGLFIIGATITFWTIESIEVMNILTYGGSFAISYPMSIYQRWLRHFFTFVAPAIFLSYYPALFFLGKPDPLGFPPWAPFVSPLVGVGVLALGLWFWRFGIQHYQSTGS